MIARSIVQHRSHAQGKAHRRLVSQDLRFQEPIDDTGPVRELNKHVTIVFSELQTETVYFRTESLRGNLDCRSSIRPTLPNRSIPQPGE
jgi:hypothetical protein